MRERFIGERRVPADIALLRTFIVNVLFLGEPRGKGNFVLVDAGVRFSSGRILKMAERLYGHGTKPSAIVLTHGHFDHVGALSKLLQVWDVPVYAHELELPFLTGVEDYSRADPTVGGGLMSILSPVYPRKGINIARCVRPLPADGQIPELSDWRWIHTPGHTKGHVSLFRDTDKACISGDAFITVKQESLFAVLSQRREPHGPPAYFTTDWQAAKKSVEKIRALQPSIVYPGHGLPVSGGMLTRFLDTLTREFEQMAVPKRGRYVTQ